MKKYLLEPFIEQTYSSTFNQRVSNSTNVTRIATNSYALGSKDPVSDSILLSGNIDTGINQSYSQLSTTILINGKSESTATTNNYSKYVKPINETNLFYPIGTDNTPTTKSYNIAPTESPLSIPFINDNSFTYFIIGIVVILIILIIVYFFIL